MKVSPITSPLPGEHLATTAPPMAPETPIDWRQRLNFWAGRALTADALELEQENRAAELARSGRVVTAGVVRGLDVALEAPAAPPNPLVTAGHFIHLLPGNGIMISGEDVIVPRPLRIALDQIPIHYVRYLDAGEPAPADVSATTPMELGGVKVETDDFASGYVPWAAVLIAQPAELGLFGNVDPTDPCELDLSADAFSDERRIDAMFLRFFQIPFDWKNDPLLTDPNDPRWRNRLAQIIFREESKGAARQYLRFRASQPAGEQWDTVLASPDVFPWEFFGVPLALLSSEVTPGGARAFYLDRASVARPGGRARARSRPALHLATEESDESLHVTGVGTPDLWRARVDQLAEHLSQLCRFGSGGNGESLSDSAAGGTAPAERARCSHDRRRATASTLVARKSAGSCGREPFLSRVDGSRSRADATRGSRRRARGQCTACALRFRTSGRRAGSHSGCRSAAGFRSATARRGTGRSVLCPGSGAVGGDPAGSAAATGFPTRLVAPAPGVHRGGNHRNPHSRSSRVSLSPSRSKRTANCRRPLTFHRPIQQALGKSAPASRRRHRSLQE